MFATRKTATSLSSKCTQRSAALIHYQHSKTKHPSLNHASLFPLNPKSQTINYNLNFLLISNLSSNVNNISINSSQPTKPRKPSVKDPIIPGLQVNVTNSDGMPIPLLEDIEISKLELSETFGFELRDLRALQKRHLATEQSQYKYASPTLFIRREAFLAHLGVITALISADKCYLFNVQTENNDNNDYDSDNEQDNNVPFITDSFNILNKFKAKLQSTLIFNTLPFEFHCLEAVCKAVVSKHRNNLQQINQMCEQILNDSNDNKYTVSSAQANISFTKIKLLQAINNTKACVDALNELLNNSDDLKAMYLNIDNKSNIKQDKQLELLLENYLWQFDEILDRLQLLLDEITMFERSIGFLINKQRNDIIRMNLKLSLLTCGFAGGALPAAIFGMNLMSHFEAHPYAFYGGAMGFGCLLPFVIWRRFKIDLQNKHIHF